MESESARVTRIRPFYASQVDAYDAIVSAPVEGWIEEIRGHRTDGGLLDAGCGTGRHAEALARAGFEVELADASPAILAVARTRNPGIRAHLADICTVDLGRRYDVVACRGVLNDMLSDVERSAAVERLAAHAAPGGVLVLDVRDRDATRDRAGRTTTTEGALPDGRTVRFRSSTTWADPLVRVRELHEIIAPGRPTESEPFDFAMRPWTRRELTDALGAAGLVDVVVDAAAHRPSGDRLVASGRRPLSFAG
ncbi:class I SAM-dependent methyltransferase [Clavibacter sp. VKM Ac-2872]|uniref:class I SAM-dependent methyltransferase n=1 Tax=Clavibacter sp. VKM Ac-2872 TaxID=2783812 RepID=UPI00188BE44E|nr:class I SAM-dependent methyltransferase [Clavibacter sp. VKM Ac-2872]